MAHSILLTGPDRRRSWSENERREILEEAFAPGAIVAAVARRREVSTGLIYTWRLIDQLALAFEELEASATEDELAAEKAVALATKFADSRLRVTYSQSGSVFATHQQVYM